MSGIDLCLRLSNWLGWMKLFEIEWSWSWLLMTFLMSFLMVLRRIIGFERFRGIIQFFVRFGDDYRYGSFEVGRPITWLKTCISNVNNSYKISLSLIILLRCFHNSLFGPGIDKLLYLAMELVNSSSEKETHIIEHLFRISSNV